MREVTLPSGATATLRDADDITFGDSEDALKAMNLKMDQNGELLTTAGEMIGELRRAVVVLGVAAWSVTDKATGQPLPLPIENPAVVRQLSGRDGAFLTKELWPLRDEIMPDFDVNPDPASPTSPSVGSVSG